MSTTRTAPVILPSGVLVRRLTRVALATLVLLGGLTLLLGYANKARCIGPEFDQDGRSGPGYDIRKDRDVCYSDIQHLWVTRDLDEHAVPYLSGGITEQGQLFGGTVEYPVLSGLQIWLSGLPADNDGEYLFFSALVMAPFGLLTAALLGQLAGWRALLWALGPPLVLYAFHNWDLPVVATTVAAVWVMHGWRTDRTPAERGVLAGVLLGIGFAFKLYPAAFVAPLALYVLTVSGRARDVPGALRVCAAAAGTAVLVNLPFAILGYDGWRAAFTFQQRRDVDLTTNSIWYWGFRPISNTEGFQAVMNWVTPVAVLASFALALAVGWRRYRLEGSYPWIAVSAAMLCGFLLLHKVHSPQYTLWLLPFLVLLRVHWGWIAAYLTADLAMGIGIFRWYYHLNQSLPVGIADGFAAQAVTIGVWGRAALLVALFWIFLHTHPITSLRIQRRRALDQQRQ
ncbi:MAG: glycosyltransferase family 87 protein [Pseudonocardiaceae bacterium]